MNRPARRRAQIRGRRAESLCAFWLRLHGYRILARNFRTPVGEIDILARRGRTLAVVEVKTRDDLRAAGESLGANQRRRLARAARYFMAARPGAEGLEVRFDAMLVTPWRAPRHVIDAWREDGS